MPARATSAKPSLGRIRALDAKLELVDGDSEMARERAAAIARYDGIRLIEDSLEIETCEGPATIGLELVEAVASFDVVLIALGGGALATGVGHVVKAFAPEVEVICVQPLGERFAGRYVVTIVCGSNVDPDAYRRWVGS